MRSVLDADTLVGAGGRTIVGGHPTRLFRLSAHGATVVQAWIEGGPVSSAPAERRLFARLVAAGALHCVPSPEPTVDSVTVVVPTNRSGRELDRCLAALTHPGVSVVVVDDASPDPDGVQRAATAHGARVVRLVAGLGPAAARNAGMAATTTPFVAFTDSDVTVDRGWLDVLMPHFQDPDVAAVAPRVHPLVPHGGAVARYEARRSPLDMGPWPAAATPGGRVAYVPSTTLVVRREHFVGFDESLQVGEDVDFCWRTVAAGHRVVYDPRASVRHDHRARLREFAKRRWIYAESVGNLAVRHPAALPATRTNGAGAILICGLVAGRAELVGMGLTAISRRTWRAVPDHPLSLRLAMRQASGHVRGTTHAVRRVWLIPLLPCAPRYSRVRKVLLCAWLVGVADRRLRPSEIPLAAADDVIAAAATLVACARARTVTPLLPLLTNHTHARPSNRKRSIPGPPRAAEMTTNLSGRVDAFDPRPSAWRSDTLNKSG